MRGALQEIDSNGYGFPEVAQIAKREGVQREETAVSLPRNVKPAWWLLYAMLPLTVLAFGLADLVPAASGWRPVSELSATLAIFVGIGLWRRANRLALTLAAYGDGSGSTQGIPSEDADLPDFSETRK